jgi:hypothetical protein
VPGLVVNRIAPGLLPHVLASFPDGLVIVSGSSGKSTTTKMLVAVLEAHGRRVFTNPSTANIAQGLTSALLERTKLNGRVDADLAVLEMDEGHGARIAPRLTARSVVLTNVMTDQIDRFADPQKVAAMLEAIAGRATESVVINADDALLEDLAAGLAPGIRVTRYGVTAEVLAGLPRGLGYSRTSASRTAEGMLVTAVDGATARVTAAGRPLEVRLPSTRLQRSPRRRICSATRSTQGSRPPPSAACRRCSAAARSSRCAARRSSSCWCRIQRASSSTSTRCPRTSSRCSSPWGRMSATPATSGPLTRRGSAPCGSHPARRRPTSPCSSSTRA